MNYYKRLVLLVIVVLAISGGIIFYTGDINMISHLSNFRPWSIILAVAFLSLGMYFDSTRLVRLARMAGERITLHQSLQVILSNYFLAMLTPGATGGPLAQVLFLRKFGMATGQATVVVLVRTILSILFLVACLPIVVYTNALEIPWFSSGAVGLATTAITAVGLGSIWFVRSRFMTSMALWLIKRFSHPRRHRLWRIFRDIQQSVGLLCSSPVDMLKVFIDTGLSLVFLYCIVPALFLGLGISVDWLTLLLRMIVLNLLLYFAPTPGGSGIAEGGFVFLFSSFVPPGTVGVLAVAWRVLAEYLPFIAGLYCTLKVFGEKFLTAEHAS